MKIFVDFSGTIAIPAVLAALLGEWLDERYATSPRYLIICLVVAFLLSAKHLTGKARKYSRDYNRLNNDSTDTTV